MKIGTFWCWLFGHKFIAEISKSPTTKLIQQTDFCVRCGITRPDLTN